MLIEKQAAEFVKEIRCAGEPSKMSKKEWKEFLEDIIGELQTDYDAVSEELDE